MLQRRRSTKAAAVKLAIDFKGLTWAGIKDLAKKAGISAHKKTRKQLERDLSGS